MTQSSSSNEPSLETNHGCYQERTQKGKPAELLLSKPSRKRAKAQTKQKFCKQRNPQMSHKCHKLLSSNRPSLTENDGRYQEGVQKNQPIPHRATVPSQHKPKSEQIAKGCWPKRPPTHRKSAKKNDDRRWSM